MLGIPISCRRRSQSALRASAIAAKEANTVLWLMRVGPWKVYANANAISDLAFQAGMVWVVTSLLVGSTEYVYSAA